ncbi:hypothetical protein JEZ13_02070 [bacterium]|nr:hypothetical protein [bacterium]
MIIREEIRRDGLAINHKLDEVFFKLYIDTFPEVDKIINVGYPTICNTEYDICKKIILNNTSENIEYCISSHARKIDLIVMSRFIDELTDRHKLSIVVWYPISECFQKRLLTNSKRNHLKHLKEIVEYWKSQQSSVPIDIALADCFSDEDEIEQKTSTWVNELIKYGYRNIIITDSMGTSTKDRIDKVFSKLKHYNFNFNNLEFHVHDDNSKAFDNLQYSISKYNIGLVSSSYMGSSERMSLISTEKIYQDILNCTIDKDIISKLRNYYNYIVNDKRSIISKFKNNVATITGSQFYLQNKPKISLLFGATTNLYLLELILGRKSNNAELECLKNYLYNSFNIFFTRDDIDEIISKKKEEFFSYINLSNPLDDNNNIKQMSEFCDKITKNNLFHKKNIIKILIPGAGLGLYTKIFVEELLRVTSINDSLKIVIHAVDNNYYNLLFTQEMYKKILSGKSVNFSTFDFVDSGIFDKTSESSKLSIEYIIQDIDTNYKYFDYDIIFAPSIFHLLNNPYEVVKEIISQISPTSLLVTAVVNDDWLLFHKCFALYKLKANEFNKEKMIFWKKFHKFSFNGPPVWFIWHIIGRDLKNLFPDLKLEHESGKIEKDSIIDNELLRKWSRNKTRTIFRKDDTYNKFDSIFSGLDSIDFLHSTKLICFSKKETSMKFKEGVYPYLRYTVFSSKIRNQHDIPLLLSDYLLDISKKKYVPQQVKYIVTLPYMHNDGKKWRSDLSSILFNINEYWSPKSLLNGFLSLSLPTFVGNKNQFSNLTDLALNQLIDFFESEYMFRVKRKFTNTEKVTININGSFNNDLNLYVLSFKIEIPKLYSDQIKKIRYELLTINPIKYKEILNSLIDKNVINGDILSLLTDYLSFDLKSDPSNTDIVGAIKKLFDKILSESILFIYNNDLPTSLKKILTNLIEKEKYSSYFLGFSVFADSEHLIGFPSVFSYANKTLGNFVTWFYSSQVYTKKSKILSYEKRLFKLNNMLKNAGQLIGNFDYELLVLSQSIKTAIISILVDSYSHNISAHSLAALKWWFDARSNKLQTLIRVGKGKSGDTSPIISSLICLYPETIEENELKAYAKISNKIYHILGLNDNSNSESYTNLQEIIDYFDNKDKSKNILQYSYEAIYDKDENKRLEQEKAKEVISFPVPIDRHIASFMRFLRDKAAFWSGVTRDIPFGGETQNLYDLLWNDFADNPLYLGSIAHSEGITKLNINIELPKQIFVSSEWYNNLVEEELINPLNQKFVKLDFARINLSIINSEKFKKINMEYHRVDADDSNQEIQHNLIRHSPYNLIFPGKWHKIVREELSKPLYEIFLPGGVVGRHSLFTIFENTIRNIKHFEVTDDMIENGLSFNIRIEPKLITFKDVVKEEPNFEDNNFFKISVYIDHNNLLKTTKSSKTSDKKEETSSKVIDFLKKKTSESIITETGSPKLGGTFQDKICAAMLLNNTFSSVDLRTRSETSKMIEYFYNDRDERYWLDFSEEPADGHTGRILKSIYLWRGEFIGYYKSEKSFTNENMSRFKFIYVDVDADEIPSDIQKVLTINGVVRIITRRNLKNNDQLITKIKYHELTEDDKNIIYQCWNRKLLEDQKIHFIQCYPRNKHNDEEAGALMSIKDYKIETFLEGVNNPENIGQNIFIRHSGETWNIPKDSIIKYRSIGWLRMKLISGDNFKLINEEDFSVQNELVELMLTKICIIDNRIHNRLFNFPKEKQALINLNVLSEEELFPKGIGKNLAETDIKKVVKKLRKYFDANNFLVIHLSFIEALNFSETNISSFFEQLFDSQDNKESVNNTKHIERKKYIVITTGRGRSLWFETIKGTKFAKTTLFKPIESLLNAVEDAIRLDDDIQIKYNLVKVLFGS